MEQKPTRCICPYNFCQECKWGYVEYPDWVETREDLEGCNFTSGCTLKLEGTYIESEEQ